MYIWKTGSFTFSGNSMVKQRIFLQGIIVTGFSCLVLACSSPTSDTDDLRLSPVINNGTGESALSIYTTEQTYSINTPVKVVVKNNTQREISIGPCFDLQYEASGGWQNVSEELPCAALGLPVKGMDSVVVNAGSLHTAVAGSYRLRLKVSVPHQASSSDSDGDTTSAATPVLETVTAVSNVFRVK